MPLTTRAVSPTDLSVHRLSASVQRDELQCVANGTLANLIRQLSSLSRNAEQLFSEIHRETLKIDHKTNTLFLRVERLAHKITQAEFKPDTASLEENNMRKAFKSCNIIDQHSLDRQTLPNSLYDLYQKCDAPPQLDHLNAYRDDPKSALRYYTDPSYFFDLWKQEMLKECSANADRRAQRSIRSPPVNKSPSRRRKQRENNGGGVVGGGQQPQRQVFPHQSANVLLNHYSTGMQASQQQQQHRQMAAQAQHYNQGGDAFLRFPAEYQAPQIAQMNGRIHAPPGMSMHPDSQQQQYNSGAPTCLPKPPGPSSQQQQPYFQSSQDSARPFQAVPPQSSAADASYALQKPLQGLSLHTSSSPNFVLEEDDDELPPPPPVLSSHTMGLAGASGSSVSQPTDSHPAEETMQYLPSGGQGQKSVVPPATSAPMPPPPPPAPPMAGSVASFGTGVAKASEEGVIPSIDGVEGDDNPDNQQISNLLMEIQSGIKLKKVQRQAELAEAKAALQESNDVAAILRRRMEHVLGNDDGSSGSGHSNEDDDGEWD